MIGKLFDCLVGIESEAKALEILGQLDFEDLDYLKIALKVKDDIDLEIDEPYEGKFC